MILPDVNVLLYAFRADSPFHSECRRWLEAVLGSEAPYGMAPQILSSVVRIATNIRAYQKPSSLNETLEFAELLLDQPHCQLVVPGHRHWGIFKQLCTSSGARGNLVADAWFAALAIENGCEWVTLDRDYARFAGLQSRQPF